MRSSSRGTGRCRLRSFGIWEIKNPTGLRGSKDRVLLQLGRTMRLRPEPGYLCLWEIPGIDRLDAWEAYFHSEAAQANRRSRAMHHAIHIERAGLYEALHQASVLEAPLYVIEFWHALTTGADEVLQSLTHRASAHPHVTMVLAMRRLGLSRTRSRRDSRCGGPLYAAANHCCEMCLAHR